MTETILRDALEYHRRGWSIIPMRLAEKKPVVPWKRYQDSQAAESTIRRWFGPESNHGIAVIFGHVSNGLVSRDFDTMVAYEDWATGQPDLAAFLPTVETHRGRHVYCRADVEHVGEIRAKLGKPNTTGAIICPDGELRAGVGCYSVVPPSKHPSGTAYRWLNPPSDFPVLNLIEAGLFSYRRATEENRGQQRTTDDMGGGCGFDASGWVSNVEIHLAIEETLPKRHGMRNRCIFELARSLKAIPGLAAKSPTELRPIVRVWHMQALSVIETKPFEETWIDFLRAWPEVKFPKGETPMSEALARAAAAKLPVVALKYEQQELRLLVSLCRELQKGSKDKPFFLSCRKAGTELGVDHTTANRWFFLLVQDGVLELVRKGSEASGKASRYRYIADH